MPLSNTKKQADFKARQNALGRFRRQKWLTDAENKKVDELIKSLRAVS